MAFKIHSIPPTTNKTIRFPNDLIEEVEQLIEGKDCTFSAFVVAAVRAAVEEVQNQQDSDRCQKPAPGCFMGIKRGAASDGCPRLVTKNQLLFSGRWAAAFLFSQKIT